MDYSPWGCKELDTAERLTLQLFGLNAKTALFFVLIVYTHTHTHTHTHRQLPFTKVEGFVVYISRF